MNEAPYSHGSIIAVKCTEGLYITPYCTVSIHLMTLSITRVQVAARVDTAVAQKLKFFHGILSMSCKFVCNSSSAETTETEFLPLMFELNKTPT
jgi:hypothetical protein